MSSDDENSGGYYNSVGSKEGWAPQSFRSSRKSRAQVKQQSIFDFLDEDEKQEKQDLDEKRDLFDTFGFTATELARKQADQKEQTQRPDELIIVPVVITESPRVRSKLDALLFMPDSTPPRMHRGTETTDEMEIQNEEVAVENMERPVVDLYEAIFSDDEEENIMTTSGDLLESLGKEQGLVVPPPEMPPPDNNKPFAKIAPKETFHFEKENIETSATNGETPRDKDMQQIDGSKFRKNRDDRSRKRLRSRRRKSSSSESDASDNSDDSRRKEKRTSREKSSSKRRSKSHKHTRKDSSPSRSNPRKEHENRKRKRRLI